MKRRAYHFFIPVCAILLAAPASRALAQTPPSPPEEDIRPPREAVIIPETGTSPLLRNLLLLALLASAGAGIWLWMRRFRPVMPAITPLDQARASLGALNADRETLTSGDLAEQTANVVRRFIAGNFGIAAPQRTTEEFLRSLTTGGASPLTPHQELLQGFLITCDKAKFAGADFDPVERYALIETAGRFVQAAACTAPPVTPPSA